MTEYMETAVEAAQLAGAYQRTRFDSTREYEYKAPGDPVSEVDRESERLILDHLDDSYPDHAVLSEERGAVGDAARRWIVDPLDGTSNFVRGHPDFTVSIALEDDGELLTGVVYRPMSDDLYAVSRDRGVHEDSIALDVSRTERLDQAVVSIPYSSSCMKRAEVWETHRRLGSITEGVRATGSGALDLAYLAAGATDAVCGFEQSEWDRAAGLFLVEHAGGTVSDHQGATRHAGDFVASNASLHQAVIDEVATSG